VVDSRKYLRERIDSDFQKTKSGQVSLRWLFIGMSILSIVFAAFATQGLAILLLIFLGILAPLIVLVYLAIAYLRDEIFGQDSRPLASSERDPLGLPRHQNHVEDSIASDHEKQSGSV